MNKSKNSVVDKINAIREKQFNDVFKDEFGEVEIDSSFLFDLEGDKKLAFKNMKERYAPIKQSNIIASNKSVHVTDDGMKYDLGG